MNKSKLPTWKQFKYLGRFLRPYEKNQITTLLVIIVLGLCVLSLKFYVWSTIVVPKAGGTYTEGLIGSPRFINPILTTNDVDQDLSHLIFSGLLKYDKNRQLVPDLATSYEISDDQLIYTFYLRQNVRWHDGEDFKADDVIFTFASIQDPEFKSPLYRNFRSVFIEKVDDQAIRFILKEPFAPFLGLLTFGILPEHLWYNVPPATADLAELNKRPVGTGPWKFESLKKDRSGSIRSFTVGQNLNYYGQKPYLSKLIFKFYGDFNSAVDGLKNKEVKGIAYLPKEFKDVLKKYKNLSFHNLDQPQYTAVFFNQKKNDLLKADYIRQALAMAVDKEKIIKEAFNREGRIIDEPSLPGIESNQDIVKYAYDPQAAVELLEKNGWKLISTTTPDGLTEQLRQKKDMVFKITLTTVDQPEMVTSATIIKQAWDQIGAQTTINIVDKTKILQDVINPREYEALLFNENSGSDPDPFPFWHSSQNEYPGANLAIFTDKTVDKLLEDARKTNNWEDRQKNYLAFQKIVAKELPAIFLFNPTYTYPLDKSLRGFDISGIALPTDRFNNLAEWYVNTKRIWK